MIYTDESIWLYAAQLSDSEILELMNGTNAN